METINTKLNKEPGSNFGCDFRVQETSEKDQRLHQQTCWEHSNQDKPADCRDKA